MSNVAIFCICVAALCVLVCGMFLYNVHRSTLKNAKIGRVYSFRYMQPLTGDYERFCAKVINSRRLSNYEINKLNHASRYRRHDGQFERSNTLVTCVMLNGDYRQFYAERSDMCRRTPIYDLVFRAMSKARRKSIAANSL